MITFVRCLLIYFIIGGIIAFIIIHGIVNNVNGAKKKPNDWFIWTIAIVNMFSWPVTLLLLLKNKITGRSDYIDQHAGELQDKLVDEFNSYFEEES